MKRKISFLVDYNTEKEKIVSSIMSKMDLGIDHISRAHETWSWETEKEITDEYIEKSKEAITAAIEEQGGKVYGIKTIM